jgi:hypothetical protein
VKTKTEERTMEEQMHPRRRKFGVVLLVLVGLFVTVADDALAIIGRPLTPVSYAGVARRTVRRAYY